MQKCIGMSNHSPLNPLEASKPQKLAAKFSCFSILPAGRFAKPQRKQIRNFEIPPTNTIEHSSQVR